MSKSTSSSSTPKSTGKIVGSIKSSSKSKVGTTVNDNGKLSASNVKMPKHGDLSERGDDTIIDKYYKKYDSRENTPKHIKNWEDVKIKRNKK